MLKSWNSAPLIAGYGLKFSPEIASLNQSLNGRIKLSIYKKQI